MAPKEKEEGERRRVVPSSAIISTDIWPEEQKNRRQSLAACSTREQYAFVALQAEG